MRNLTALSRSRLIIGAAGTGLVVLFVLVLSYVAGTTGGGNAEEGSRQASTPTAGSEAPVAEDDSPLDLPLVREHGPPNDDAQAVSGNLDSTLSPEPGNGDAAPLPGGSAVAPASRAAEPASAPSPAPVRSGGRDAEPAPAPASPPPPPVPERSSTTTPAREPESASAAPPPVRNVLPVDEARPAGREPSASRATSTPAPPQANSASRPAGIYLVLDNGTREPLEPAVISQVVTEGGFFGGRRQTGVTRGLRASARSTDHYQTFEFHLPGTAVLGEIANPNQFLLVQMFEAEEYDERELDFDSAGPDPDRVIPFDVERIGPDSFHVTPSEPLGLGEFCFFNLESASATLGQGRPGLTIFDFGVDPR